MLLILLWAVLFRKDSAVASDDMMRIEEENIAKTENENAELGTRDKCSNKLTPF